MAAQVCPTAHAFAALQRQATVAADPTVHPGVHAPAPVPAVALHQEPAAHEADWPHRHADVLAAPSAVSAQTDGGVAIRRLSCAIAVELNLVSAARARIAARTLAKVAEGPCCEAFARTMSPNVRPTPSSSARPAAAMLRSALRPASASSEETSNSTRSGEYAELKPSSVWAQ